MSGSAFKVRTCDGIEFIMTEVEAKRISLVWSAFQDFGKSAVIPMPTVTSEVFEQILHFVRVGYGKEMQCIKEIVDKNQGKIKDVLIAAQYLQVKELNEYMSIYIRDIMQNAATVDDLQKNLNIQTTLSESERSNVAQTLETSS